MSKENLFAYNKRKHFALKNLLVSIAFVFKLFFCRYRKKVKKVLHLSLHHTHFFLFESNHNSYKKIENEDKLKTSNSSSRHVLKQKKPESERLFPQDILRKK
jgi:hypothetical protein